MSDDYFAENHNKRMDGGEVTIRPARPKDVPTMFEVRFSVTENIMTREELAEEGVTEASVAEMIRTAPCAWVAEIADRMVGLCVVSLEEGEVMGLFVAPAHAGRGIGRRLLQVAEPALFAHHPVIRLSTGRGTQAVAFYRRLDWQDVTKPEDESVHFEKKSPFPDLAGSSSLGT